MATELEAYEEWLQAKRLTSDHKVRFFVWWVERFLRLRSTRPAEAWRDTLRVFLEDLGEGRTLSWQLRQAADAVTLYCGQFCEQKVAGMATLEHGLSKPAGISCMGQSGGPSDSGEAGGEPVLRGRARYD